MSTSVFVRGFDFGTSEQDISKHCRTAGPVTSVEMSGKGAAVVTFASAAGASKAVKTLNQSVISGNSRYIDVKINDESKGQKRTFAAADGPSCRVFIRGFDFGTTDEQLEAHASQVGTIQKVHWCTKGSAIVVYSSPAEAQAAVDNLNQTTIEGNSRFIDVIMKDAVDQGPPAKRTKTSAPGGKGFGGKGGGKFEQAVAQMASKMVSQMSASMSLPWMEPKSLPWMTKPVQAKGASKGGGKGKKGGDHSDEDPAGAGRVFVRGFDFDTTDEQLHAHMASVGPIHDVHWVNKGSAVVVYKKAMSAKKAASTLNQTVVSGNNRYIDVILKD